MRARLGLLSAALLAASCSGGTYVTITLAAAGTPPAGVTRIDLDLSLGGKSASATLQQAGGITFPTTTVLDVASGEGMMSITANARDGGGAIVAQASGTATVTRGKSTTATLTFGATSDVDMAGNDAGPCGVCDPAATCAQNGDSVTCTCPAGYTGDGFTCTDIDECAAGGGANCNANATCSNTPGSFTCTCNAGYSGDGFNCTQIWVKVADVPMIDLLNVGNAIGLGNRVYFSNEPSASAAAYFKSIDISVSTPMAADEPAMPPFNGSQNDWCWCGGCGGNSRFTIVNTRLYYDCYGFEFLETSGAHAWTSQNANWPTTVQRHGSAHAAVGTKIYMISGMDNNNVDVQTVQTVDVSGATPAVSTTLPNYPIKVQQAGTFVFGTKIYVFGGRTLVGSNYQNTHAMYMIDTAAGMPTWTQQADMPFDLSYYMPYTAMYKSKGWVFDSGQTLHSYDPANNMWDAVPPVAAPPGGGTGGRRWMATTAGTPTASLFAINYVSGTSTVSVQIFKYGL